jgi:ribosomal protein S27AE
MKKQFAVASGLLAAFASDAAGLDRQDLDKKLQALEKAPAPTQLAPGAMCYAPPPPRQQTSYTCPKCGEKTIYANSDNGFWKVGDVDALRRTVKAIQAKGLDVSLDESAFCQKCGKDSKAKEFALEVKWPGQEKSHRATLQGTTDLQILLEFLDGKDKHDAGPGGEKPMKDYLPRLRKLLGVDAAGKPEEKKP